MKKVYRKIKKFFKSPSKFWEDSRFNIKAKYLKKNDKELLNLIENISNEQLKKILQYDKNLLNLIENTSNKQLKKFLQHDKNLLKPIQKFDETYIISLLKKYNIPTLYIKPFEKNLKWAFCINKNQKKAFFINFLTILTKENINLKYKYNKKIKVPKSVQEIWSDIFNLNTVDIRLSTEKAIDANRIWIRLEFWEDNEEFYKAPVKNDISVKLWKDTASKFNIFKKVIDYRTILNMPHEKEVNFKVDLVFTWVNSYDNEWKEMYLKYKPNTESDNNNLSRFLTRDELKYSLRSWDKYGKFIDKIYIVSNCKPPKWLNLNNTKIKWVYHEEIINKKYLPTFSSHAIEANLHKIKGLNNHFIYCNDDVMLLKEAQINDFYFSNGIAKVRLEKYGMVNGEINSEHPDYLNAARNSQKLLENTFKKTATQLHTHSPQSMRIDILNKMETLYKNKFEETTSHKFRTINDISVASFLYPHFAIMSGNALDSNEKVEFVHQNKNFKKILNDLVKLKKDNKNELLPLSLCLNDGADSHLNETWNKEVVTFLENFFPEKSQFEK